MPRLVDSSDPLSYLRVVIGILLVVATLAALVLAISGIAPRALLLVGLFWGIYGMFYAVVDGILEPLIDFGNRVITGIGLSRPSESFSDVETMEAQGNFDLAAGVYGERARQQGEAEAALRQARILAGPLQDPGRAMVALRQFLELHPDAPGIRRVRARLAALKSSIPDPQSSFET